MENQITKYKLNLQLFAEDEQENQPADQQSSDSQKEKTPPTPPEEGDEKKQTPPPVADPNKPGETQSKEEDAKFAKLRHERDIAKAKAAGDAEGYKRARIKSVGGKNPYTDTPIESDEDFEFYELQDEVKAKGGDPNKPYEVEQLRREKMAEAKRLAEENKSEQEKADQKATQEVKEYIAEGHTQQELQEHWNDKKFIEFAEDLLGIVPLKTIIAKFDKAYPKENQKAKQEAANKVSNPGSASTIDDQERHVKKVSEMSREEFQQYMEDVKSGKRKIE